MIRHERRSVEELDSRRKYKRLRKCKGRERVRRSIKLRVIKCKEFASKSGRETNKIRQREREEDEKFIYKFIVLVK